MLDNELLKLSIDSDTISIELKRDLTRNDFVPVVEEANSISFIMGWMDEDYSGWRFSEDKATLKIYLACGKEILNALENLKQKVSKRSYQEAFPYIQPLIKVFKQIETGEINKTEISNDKSLYDKAIKECTESIQGLNKRNMMHEFSSFF